MNFLPPQASQGPLSGTVKLLYSFVTFQAFRLGNSIFLSISARLWERLEKVQVLELGYINKRQEATTICQALGPGAAGSFKK